MDNTPDQFEAPQYCKDAARVVFAAYPSRKSSPQEKDDFAIHLRSLPMGVLVRAAFRVTEMSKLFLPNASEFVEWAKKIDRQAQAQESTSSDPAPYMGEPAHLADGNPFEQLAQKWERENATPGFRVDNQSRAREVNTLHAKHPIVRGFEGDLLDWKMAAAGDREDEAT